MVTIVTSMQYPICLKSIFEYKPIEFMKCPSCGSNIDETFNFCINCGTTLVNLMENFSVEQLTEPVNSETIYEDNSIINEQIAALQYFIKEKIVNQIENIRQNSILVDLNQIEISLTPYKMFHLRVDEQFFGGSNLIYDLDSSEYVFVDRNLQDVQPPENNLLESEKALEFLQIFEKAGVAVPPLQTMTIDENSLKRKYQQEFSKRISYVGQNNRTYQKTCTPRLSSIYLSEMKDIIHIHLTIPFRIKNTEETFHIHSFPIGNEQLIVENSLGAVVREACFYCNSLSQNIPTCDVCNIKVCQECSKDNDLSNTNIRICKTSNCSSYYNEIVNDIVEENDYEKMFKLEGHDDKLKSLNFRYHTVFALIEIVFGYLLFSSRVLGGLSLPIDSTLLNNIIVLAVILLFNHLIIIPLIMKYVAEKMKSQLAELSSQDKHSRFAIQIEKFEFIDNKFPVSLQEPSEDWLFLKNGKSRLPKKQSKLSKPDLELDFDKIISYSLLISFIPALIMGGFSDAGSDVPFSDMTLSGKMGYILVLFHTISLIGFAIVYYGKFKDQRNVPKYVEYASYILKLYMLVFVIAFVIYWYLLFQWFFSDGTKARVKAWFENFFTIS